jgi:hypothetical protein
MAATVCRAADNARKARREVDRAGALSVVAPSVLGDRTPPDEEEVFEMMLVDCTTCPVRDVHCADCMVTALDALDTAAGGVPPSSTRLTLTRRAPTRPPLASAGSETDTSDGGAGTDPGVLPLDRAERRAVSVLLGAGLVSVGAANAARAVPSSVDSSVQRPSRAQHEATSSPGSASSRGSASSTASRGRRAAG